MHFIVLFSSFVCIVISGSFASPVVRGSGSVQVDSDCTTPGAMLMTVCSSQMCLPILKCLRDNDGLGFCFGLVGPQESGMASSHDSGHCITVFPPPSR
jgi:hypothetical protein